MKQINNLEHVRSSLIFTILLILYAIVMSNLYVMQVQRQNFFKNLASKQYNINITTQPERAYIYDKKGVAIALNKDSFSAFIIPKQVTDREKINTFLQENFPSALDRLSESWDKNFFFIARKLTDEQKKCIEQASISEISILQEPSRYYPYKCLSPIIGMTDIDNRGVIGLELQYDAALKGTQTTHTLKKDARTNHYYFEKELTEQGQSGQPLTITIDAALQFKVTEILEKTTLAFQAKEAAAIIMDPETGEIAVMASYPYFDPNNIDKLDMESTKNRPISQAFESGSVIKTFCALAALELGVVTLDEIIDCQDTKETKIDGIRVRTVAPHGKIPYLQVIQNSNNIGTVKVAKRMNQKLYDFYNLVGFGQASGLHFPGENKGYVNPPANWSAYSIVSLSFGYEITTNLLQLARALSIIYNGGYLVLPQLLVNNNQNIVTSKQNSLISQTTLQSLDTILTGCVEQSSGKRAAIQGYKVAGKTGTANILQDGKYNEDKHLNTFIGYVEKDGYKRVIAVYVKESKIAQYSSVITAPLFQKIGQAMLLHDHIL